MKNKHKISFNRLSDTDFEEFCVDLLEEIGFVNINWRKGTGKKSSPSDSGRDIEGSFLRVDVDGTRSEERWFFDCNVTKKAFLPKELQNLLAWAEAERPDVAVFIVSNSLSNPAKDYIETYQRNNRPPFQIKYWERPRLETMTRGRETFSKCTDC